MVDLECRGLHLEFISRLASLSPSASLSLSLLCVWSHQCVWCTQTSVWMWPSLIVPHTHLLAPHEVLITYLFSSGLLLDIKMIDSFYSAHIYQALFDKLCFSWVSTNASFSHFKFITHRCGLLFTRLIVSPANYMRARIILHAQSLFIPGGINKHKRASISKAAGAVKEPIVYAKLADSTTTLETGDRDGLKIFCFL